MAAREKRWFHPDETEQYELATQAWTKSEGHFALLASDGKHRAVDALRTQISEDKALKGYYLETRWADPFLICYASTSPLSMFELALIEEPRKRRIAEAGIEVRSRECEDALTEKARIFQQVYVEFMRRFGQKGNLKGLTDPYGGRPDYPEATRKFPDGVALLVWIFEDKEGFRKHHADVLKEHMPDAVTGYFVPSNGRVFLYDQGADRVTEISTRVHECVHQLQNWFWSQNHGWRHHSTNQNFLNEGIAEWFAAVRMDAKQDLDFVNVNTARLRQLIGLRCAFRDAEMKYPLFPLKALTGFTSYGEVVQWVGGTSGRARMY